MHRLFSAFIFSDRRLLISSAIVAAGFFSSKVLGLLREILIARAFGTRGDLDAFFAATQFSDLLFAVVAGGALASVFIPVFSGYLIQGDDARRAGWKFASAVVNAVFLIVLGFALVGMIFAQPFTDHFLAPGFPPERRALTADLLRLILLATIIFGVSGTLTGILHAHNHFVLPALAPSLYNLGMIAGTVWLAPRLGIFGLAYGVVAGSALHLVIQLPGLVRHGAHYFLTLGWRHAGMASLLALVGPRVVTMLAVRATSIIMTNAASRLSEGSISALSYAYSLWQFPETLIGTAIALAAFPRLAACASANKIAELRALYRLALFSILSMAIPAALVAILFARPIVSFLFQRGAFGGASTELVAAVLQCYALAIIGESLLELTARAFYAQRNARTPMFVALASMMLRAALIIWWSNLFGAPGIALAYAVGVVTEGGALWWLAQKQG
jgi:putative peptidoglycan lipid II flippase